MINREPDKQLLRQAFDLVVEAYNDPTYQSKLHAWRKQSPAHEQAAKQAESDWSTLGRVDDIPLSRLDTIKMAIQLRISRLAEHPPQLIPAISTAFAVMLIVVIYLGINIASPPSLQHDTASAINKVKTISLPELYRTGWGQQRTILLEDGSEVWLDWKTELTVSMTSSKREVELRQGKALFSVASDRDRPFSVASGDTVTTALGTEFVVHRVGAKAVEVEVLEGLVGVRSKKRLIDTRLGVADVVRVRDGNVGQVTTRPLSEIGTWREGILVFEQRPLAEALETLQPYTSYQIDVSGLFDAKRPVSGTFVLSKADDALRAIMQSYRLTGKIQGRNTLVLRSLAPERP